jgi:hypothetical protein
MSTRLLVGAGGEEGRLVDQIGEIRPGEARGAAGDDGGLHVLGRRDLAHVHLEDLLAPAHVGQGHHHLAVEAPGAQQGRVEHVGAVGGGDDDDALVALEAVHLHQELVQGLLALVVTAAQAGPAVAAHRVDLVDEDDAGGVLLGLLEHVAHPRGAHAHEHLHEVRAGDGEEGHLGLAGDGPGQQGLARARGADHQHALGDLAAELLELGSGSRRKSTISATSSLASSAPATSWKVTLTWSSESMRARLLPKDMAPRPPPPPCIWRMKKIQSPIRMNSGNQLIRICHQDRRLLRGRRLDGDVVVEQVPHQAVVAGAVGGERWPDALTPSMVRP